MIDTRIAIEETADVDAREAANRAHMIDYISDTYKMMYGIRPRWYDFDSMSYGALCELYDYTSEEWAQQSHIEEEQEWYDVHPEDDDMWDDLYRDMGW